MRNIFKGIFIFTIFAASMQAQASTWYTFNATDKVVFFFDMDTIIKNKSTVTMWVKYVNNKKFPDSDGSYSTAFKLLLDCKKRTSKTLSSSTYDASRGFLKSSSIPGPTSDIEPDTILERLYKTACSPDFPNKSESEKYVLVPNNDIYIFTETYFAYMESKKNDPAPK